MNPVTIAFTAFVCLVAGFIIGAIASKTVHVEVAAIRSGTQAAFTAVAQDMRALHERVQKMEGAAEDKAPSLVIH